VTGHCVITDVALSLALSLAASSAHLPGAQKRKRMDGFVLVVVLAFAGLSCVPVDWQKQQTAWIQVILMAAGIVLIGLYLIVR
jgi:hypothetical protein